MGHCGNAAAKSGDNILSLVDTKTNMHYLTFIVNNGVLGESKAQMNQKPSNKYHPNIKQLLLSPYVKTIKGLGYQPENNFQFEDLSPQDQQSILSVKPHMDNYVGHANNETGKNRTYIVEEEHYLFDKKISNKEFEELIDALVKHDLPLWADDDDEDEQDLTSGPRLVSIAREFIRRGLPLNPKIYKEIVKNSFASYYYAANYLDPKNTPAELIKSLARNPESGMSYAVDILKGKNVPDVILTKIQEDNVGNYVQSLMAKNYPIPDWCLDYVKFEIDLQVQFYDRWLEANQGQFGVIPNKAYELISAEAAFKILWKLNDRQTDGFDDRILKIARITVEDWLAIKREYWDGEDRYHQDRHGNVFRVR